ncbi:MAG: hypothetical protein ABFS42_03080 [Candidatus Krumholzibacteriota bacterium]
MILMRHLVILVNGCRRAGVLWALAVVVCGTQAMVPARSAAAGDDEAPDLTLSFTTLDTMSLGDAGIIAGITWMGPDTLVVLEAIPDSMSRSGDREVSLVFRDRAGDILLREDFSGVLDRALAWDGEYLYSCGDAKDGSSILYQIQVDTLQVEEAFDAPGHRPGAMCFDGRYVWLSDRDTGRVDRFDPEAGAITRSAVTPGFSPYGVAWDGKNMWVTDSGTGRLYRLSGSRRSWSATVDTGSFLFRGQDVLLLHDGRTFWYVIPQERVAVELLFN